MVKLLKNIPLVDNISVRRISPTGTWIFFGLKVPDTGDGWPIYFVDYLFAWILNSRLLQGERSIYLPSSTHSCYWLQSFLPAIDYSTGFCIPLKRITGVRPSTAILFQFSRKGRIWQGLICIRFLIRITTKALLRCLIHKISKLLLSNWAYWMLIYEARRSAQNSCEYPCPHALRILHETIQTKENRGLSKVGSRDEGPISVFK